MAFGTCGRLCEVQSCVSKTISSNSSKSLLPSFEDPNKLAGTPTPLLEPLNILITTFVSSIVPLKVNLNKKVQNIIGAVVEIRLATAKSFCERPFKAYFLDIYKGDSYMSCYNSVNNVKVWFFPPGINLRRFYAKALAI